MRIGNLVRSATLGAVLIAGGATGFHAYFGSATSFAQTQKSTDTETTTLSRDKLRYAISLSDAFKEITKTVTPAVVNIRVTGHADAADTTGDDGQGEMQIPDELRKFFEQRGGRQAPHTPAPRGQQRQRMGEGSGVIVREDGYIITNNHVVEGADELTVKLADDREYPGTVLGTDPDSDLAVVKIEASHLTPAKFGDSDTLEP